MPQPNKLTKREEQVLDHLAMGLHNKEIARELVIAVTTVEGHLHKIYQKLNVSSRGEAIAFYYQANQRGAHVTSSQGDSTHGCAIDCNTVFPS